MLTAGFSWPFFHGLSVELQAVMPTFNWTILALTTYWALAASNTVENKNRKDPRPLGQLLLGRID